MPLSVSDIEKFPKAELHRHLDGAVPADVVRRIACRDGIREFITRTGLRVPVSDAVAFEGFYQVVEVPNFDEFLARFDFVLGIMQTPDHIEEICYEAVCDVAKKNIWYAEWTAAPAYHTRQGMRVREVVTSMRKGLKRGYRDTGALGKLILGIQREAIRKQKPEDARDPLGLEIAKAAIEFQGDGVVALGLVCNEALYPPELYTEAFDLAKHAGMKLAIHAGEAGADRKKNVRTAVEKLGADGIGHGIPVGRDPALIELLKARSVRLETNPLSNLLTQAISSLDELGLDRLLASGMPVSINSDDPILFRKELADNFKAVLDFYQWGEQELVEFTRNALTSSFLATKEKEVLFRTFRNKGLGVIR